MTKTKNRTLAAAFVLIVALLLVGGSLAYFTSDDTAHNVITMNDFGIEVLEWADAEKTEPFPEDGISNIMPGDTITKIAEVKNTGNGKAWIRVKVEKKFAVPYGTPDPSLIILDYDTVHWTRNGDYFYYNTPLEKGGITEPLFKTVTFAPGMGNMYERATVSIDVKAQGVQTANNGTTALNATGWPA